MRWWEKQIGGTARGRIIALLRRGASTVEELAAELGVTDNAVRAHLQLLEREGLIQASGTRQGPGAGKPATTYELSERSESALSSAYAPVLTALLQILAERMPPESLDDILRQVGSGSGRPPLRGAPWTRGCAPQQSCSRDLVPSWTWSGRQPDTRSAGTPAPSPAPYAASPGRVTPWRS